MAEDFALVTALWHGSPVRRLVRHGLAGVGAAAFAVVAGVTTLGAPTTTTLAVPATTVVQAVRPTPDPAVDAQRAAAAQRQNRDAERTRVTAAAAAALIERVEPYCVISTAPDAAASASADSPGPS